VAPLRWPLGPLQLSDAPPGSTSSYATRNCQNWICASVTGGAGARMLSLPFHNERQKAFLILTEQPVFCAVSISTTINFAGTLYLYRFFRYQVTVWCNNRRKGTGYKFPFQIGKQRRNLVKIRQILLIRSKKLRNFVRSGIFDIRYNTLNRWAEPNLHEKGG